LKIVGFVEGARRDGPGIVGVPMILASAAAQGNEIVLIMGGGASFGSEKYLSSDPDGAAKRVEGHGTFGVLRVNARTSYSFCPSILWRFSRIVRDADIVTLHSLYSFPVLAGYILARLHRKPYAFWPHGVLAPFQRTVSAGRKRIYNKLFADQILANASVILYSAEGERKEAEDMALTAPSVIAAEGFNAEEFDDLPQRGKFRARFLGGHTGPLILFLARINVKKGVDVLIEAMKHVIAERPDARLAIVGRPDPASFGNQVQEWLKESGVEDCTVLPGMADSQMRLEAFADADVYVLPSHAENFGFTVFEAMACGVPVVVSDSLNFAEDFVKGGAGFALPRAPDEFAAAILRLVNGPELHRQMAACGHALARQYSWDETGSKVSKALSCVIGKRPFPASLSPREMAQVQL
jgi:glycosyltransferase involved in cell wall biosynthesis